MFSLYHALLAHHARQLTPVRCAEQTITNIHRLFEDVVIENRLAALVIGTLPSVDFRSTGELARLREIERTARDAFFFATHGDEIFNSSASATDTELSFAVIASRAPQQIAERFLVIADARFSVLLVSVRETHADATRASGDDCFWTFEPDIIYSALEYLMARATAESPLHAAAFSTAVSTSMPQATSPQLTISVTTKLARLLQEQAGREVAIHRVVNAIHNSPDLESILQTTVNEIGRTLDARYCVIHINPEAAALSPHAKYYFRDEAKRAADQPALTSELNHYAACFAEHSTEHFAEHSAAHTTSCVTDERAADRSLLVAAPLAYQGQPVGVLLVRRDASVHLWQGTEAMLLGTVADQVAEAVGRARLLAQMRQQAFVDDLSGCFNQRFFRLQLEREIAAGVRINQPISLIMLDVDAFGGTSDDPGTAANDAARRVLAETLREGLRIMDVAARLDSGEFVLILPQTDASGALIVAERLRQQVASVKVPGVGRITASFGIAAFPVDADSLDQLIAAATHAFKDAQITGRNHVRLASNY